MADNVTTNAGSGGATIAADEIAGVHYPRTKLIIGADGTNDGDVSSANPLPVTGTAIDAIQTAVEILDNAIAGSEMQVDVVGALPAGDNNIGNVDVASIADAHSADFDSGAGTDTTLAFGIAVPASGGAAVVPGDATAGLKVDLGADNDVTVTGTVTVDLGANNDVIQATHDNFNANANVQQGDADVGAGNPLEVTLANGSVPSHAVTNAGTFAVQVDAALPAGTNAIGKLAANDGVDIGDVDVATITNAHSADFDSGAGTDTTLAFGIAVPASGGAAVIPGDATAGLKVDLGSDNDVTVTGSVTANAGTNLNTSALALESGGNLATLAGAVAGTEVQVDVVASLPAGTNAIGKLAANDGVDVGDVTVNNAAGSAVYVQPGSGASFPVTDNSGSLTVDVPAVATGGATPGKLISAATTNGTSVKASAGTVYSLAVFNLNASARYLKLYNKASAPTVGSDTPVQVFMIPGNTAGAGLVLPIPACGMAFDTGIAFALTTGIADSDTGAVAANELCLSYSYK